MAGLLMQTWPMLLHVHRTTTDNLVTVTIGREFVGRNERRIAFLDNEYLQCHKYYYYEYKLLQGLRTGIKVKL